MKYLVIAIASCACAAGLINAASAQDSGSSGSGRIEINVSGFVSKDNQAIGGDFSSEDGELNASTAIAGSIVVEAGDRVDLRVTISDMDTRNNLAIGNAIAGSVVIRAGKYFY